MQLYTEDEWHIGLDGEVTGLDGEVRDFHAGSVLSFL